MHVVYICISVLMNYDCTTHPILPFITIITKFLSKRCIKRVLDTKDERPSLFRFYRKTFLRRVDPKQPKNVKFSLCSIIETFLRGGASRLFRGGGKILRGGAKRSQGGGGCAPPHTSHQNPAMITSIAFKFASYIF